MQRRRLIGVGIGVLAAALLGLAVLLFIAALGTALGESTEKSTSDALAVGSLVAGVGFLAALVGAIVVLVSARTPGQAASQRRSPGPRTVLGAVGYLIALWFSLGLIFQNAAGASGSQAPVSSIVLILSLAGFVTVFAGGLAAFAMRRSSRLVALTAVAAGTLYGVAAIIGLVFGQGF